jgi:hypothetical protein
VEELRVLRDYLFEWNEMEGKREKEYLKRTIFALEFSDSFLHSISC